MAGTDFTVLSVLERSHIVETVRETIRTLRIVDASFAPMDAHIEELQEVLRILCAEEEENDDSE